jgi:aminopeptidase YwaD
VVDFFCLGVEENNNVLAGVNVFPNPAHDQVNLSIPAGVENFKIKVVNVLGAVVLEEKVSNNTKDVISLNMSNKPKGVYFMSLEANNEKITRKIVIE